jgi:hypothetical protein
MDVEKILNDAGYSTVSGAENVLAAIKKVSDGGTKPLCSGYRVFPDGQKCGGCNDCGEKGEIWTP